LIKSEVEGTCFMLPSSNPAQHENMLLDCK
jgi:hypothetical protein